MLSVTKILLLISTVTVTCQKVNYDLDYVNNFALNLTQRIYQFQVNDRTNFGLSPLSIWTMLALLSEAASNETFKEINELLSITSISNLNEVINKISRAANNDDIKTRKRSAMFINEDNRIVRDFYEAAREFLTEVCTVNAKNTNKLAKDINRYVCLATDGVIRKAVEPDDLKDLKMLLINVMYFNAKWTEPFDRNLTKMEKFFLEPRKVRPVMMMKQEINVHTGYLKNIDAKLFMLDYGRNRDVSMVILMPMHLGDLDKMMNGLQSYDVANWFELTRLTRMWFVIPKFEYTSDLDMNLYLKSMGLLSIFDEKTSDLSGLSDLPIHVTKLVQKVVISVSEEGTTVKAVTRANVPYRNDIRTVIIDQPFAYFIVERRSKLILFSGVYFGPPKFSV